MRDDRRAYKLFEGGGVFTAEADGQFLVVLDERMLAEEDDADDGVRTIRFATEAERDAYLMARFGPPSRHPWDD